MRLFIVSLFFALADGLAPGSTDAQNPQPCLPPDLVSKVAGVLLVEPQSIQGQEQPADGERAFKARSDVLRVRKQLEDVVNMINYSQVCRDARASLRDACDASGKVGRYLLLKSLSQPDLLTRMHSGLPQDAQASSLNAKFTINNLTNELKEEYNYLHANSLFECNYVVALCKARGEEDLQSKLDKFVAQSHAKRVKMFVNARREVRHYALERVPRRTLSREQNRREVGGTVEWVGNLLRHFAQRDDCKGVVANTAVFDRIVYVLRGCKASLATGIHTPTLDEKRASIEKMHADTVFPVVARTISEVCQRHVSPADPNYEKYSSVESVLRLLDGTA